MLALNVLVASAGVPIYVRTCNLTGKKEVMIVPQNDKCCNTVAKQALPINVKKGCCTENALYLKNDHPALLFGKTNLLAWSLTFMPLLKVHNALASNSYFYSANKAAPNIEDKPLHILHQAFRI